MLHAPIPLLTVRRPPTPTLNQRNLLPWSYFLTAPLRNFSSLNSLLIPQGTSLSGLGEPLQRVQVTSEVRTSNMWNPPIPPPQQRLRRPVALQSPRLNFGGGGGDFIPRPPGQHKDDVFQAHLEAQIQQKRTRLAPGMSPPQDDLFNPRAQRNQTRRQHTPPNQRGYAYFGSSGSGGSPRVQPQGGPLANTYGVNPTQSFAAAPPRSMPNLRPQFQSRRHDGERSVPRGDMPLTAQANLPPEMGTPLLTALNGLYDDLHQQRERRMEQRWNASVVAERNFEFGSRTV